MRALRRFLRRISSWTKRREYEARLSAEIADHIALETAENLRAGMSREEARREAALKFGTVEAVRERWRDKRGMPSIERLAQDVRYACRRLRNAPVFTITTVLTLALGIGATTSIFTLIYAVLMKSLAVANPAELYRLGKQSRCCYWGGYSQDPEFSLVSWELYKHLRDNTKGFAVLAAFSASEPLFGVRRAGSPDAAQSYPGEFVSGNYFEMFGIKAYAGRALTAADDRRDAAPAAVMSYRLWQQRYGSDVSVIGSTFNLNDKPFTIVGITPPGFFGDRLRNDPPDFFLPLNTEPLLDSNPDLYTPDNNWLDLIGRIRPGLKPALVEAEMRVELQHWLRSHWGDMSANDRAKASRQTLFLSPGGAGITSLREEYEHWLAILMLISGFALLIICANVANLMLVRGMERRRQAALSMALGARPARVIRQALTESMLLALVGGAIGLAVAFGGTRLILHFVFPKTTGMAGIPIDASPSMPVLLFALGVSAVAGIAFGAAPAWMATKIDPMEALRAGGRAMVRAMSLPRRALVAIQTALSLVLLSISGLLTAALWNLENQNFGFDLDRRLVVHIEPKLAGYGPDRLTSLYERIHDSLSSVPGVSGVALANYSPMGGNNWGGAVWVDGRRPPGPGDGNFVFWDRVTAGYFDVIGNPILKGRGISRQDTATSPHVAVINEAFARKYFRDDDPLGKRFGQHGVGSAREYEIVGIARDARYLTFDLTKPITPGFFLPEGQHDFSRKAPRKEANPGSHFLHDVVIDTKPGANLSFARVSQTIASVDPSLPIIWYRTLKNQVSGQFRQQRLIARLASFFGVLSLVLSCIGIYGVVALSAGNRAGEIGVRIALGAKRGDIIRLVLRGAFALILIGMLLGAPLAFAADRFLGNQLYGMDPYRPLVTLIAMLPLGVSGLVAAFVPAFRATLISPFEALRAE